MIADLLQFAAEFKDNDSNGHRTYLSVCSVGRQLNELDPASLAARSLQLRHGCAAFGNCIGCDAGQELAATLLEVATSVDGQPSAQPQHLEMLVEYYGHTGPHRRLLKGCDKGARLEEIVAKFHKYESARELVAEMDEESGCTKRSSCLGCEYGFTHLVTMLSNLVDEGMDGSAGAEMRDAGVDRYLH